ncbi:hypothetical protein M514_16913 [Trichuris suis]|uniref:C2 domain-containing protein n=1 Tax=Trichuris suis TaxID=68888 RepID=A0A085NMU5_9BILA|nr:hypothetical protein M514_16913 [Trichuris suis]
MVVHISSKGICTPRKWRTPRRGRHPLRERHEENEKHNRAREQSWTIQIMLKRGKNLAVCDANGSSDPYVKFKYNGKPVYKSKIVYQNVNPVWNERFSFTASNMSLPLHMQVYDYDRFASDDFMGSAKLYLNAFKENKYHFLSKFRLDYIQLRVYEVQISLATSSSSVSMGYLIVQILVSQSSNEADDRVSVPFFPFA